MAHRWDFVFAWLFIACVIMPTIVRWISDANISGVTVDSHPLASILGQIAWTLVLGFFFLIKVVERNKEAKNE